MRNLSSRLYTEDLVLPLSLVRQYIRARGWRDVDVYGPYATMYVKLGVEAELILPNIDTVADYRLRIAELLDAVSESEGRSVYYVISDVLSGT